MRCTLCDRCKKIIENERKIKVVTYARPLEVRPGARCPAPANDRQMNDHIWTKELCPECALEFESFMDMEDASGSGSGGSGTGGTGEDNTGGAGGNTGDVPGGDGTDDTGNTGSTGDGGADGGDPGDPGQATE